MIFVRPCRSATIRTRLDAEAIRERMAEVAGQEPPQGFAYLKSHGYFLGGSVSDREFHLDYKFNNPRNPQKYAVHGKVQDTKDWRILRLKLTAHSPWLSWIELSVLGALALYYVFSGEMPPTPAIAVFLAVTAVYAFANLLVIPETVKARVSGAVAWHVNGSVRVGDKWVVP